MGTASPLGDSLLMEQACLPSPSQPRHTAVCFWGFMSHGVRLSGPQHPPVPSDSASLALPTPFRHNPTLGLFSLHLHSLQETYEAKRKEFLSELQRKEEEMRQMFVNKVKETELELKEKEREVSWGLGVWQGRSLAGRQEGLATSWPTRKPGLPLSAPSSTRSLSTSSGSTRRRSAR